MLGFLRLRKAKSKKSAADARPSYGELVKQSTEYQLRINDFGRQIEKLEQRMEDILAKVKDENSEIAKRGLAEQYLRTKRLVQRRFEQRTMFVKAQELVDEQVLNIELRNSMPQEILALDSPEAPRERAMVEVLRDRVNQAYEDMLSSFDDGEKNWSGSSREESAVQDILALFQKSKDREIGAALSAIEEDLRTIPILGLAAEDER
jgi:hypothetical protein